MKENEYIKAFVKRLRMMYCVFFGGAMVFLFVWLFILYVTCERCLFAFCVLVFCIYCFNVIKERERKKKTVNVEKANLTVSKSI